MQDLTHEDGCPELLPSGPYATPGLNFNRGKINQRTHYFLPENRAFGLLDAGIRENSSECVGCLLIENDA